MPLADNHGSLKKGQRVYFDDFEIGQRFKTVSFTVDKVDVVDFASRWDPQPFHIDEEAAKASLFGGLTACSAHIFSIFCRIAPQWLFHVDLQVMAGLGFDAMRIHKPVYAGDTLYCMVNVDQLKASRTKPDRGIVTNFCQLYNQHDECVFEVYSTAMVARNINNQA